MVIYRCWKKGVFIDGVMVGWCPVFEKEHCGVWGSSITEAENQCAPPRHKRTCFRTLSANTEMMFRARWNRGWVGGEGAEGRARRCIVAVHPLPSAPPPHHRPKVRHWWLVQRNERSAQDAFDWPPPPPPPLPPRPSSIPVRRNAFCMHFARKKPHVLCASVAKIKHGYNIGGEILWKHRGGKKPERKSCVRIPDDLSKITGGMERSMLKL